MNLKAHSDTSTGKIYGCKKGSWKYYHEEGHLVFDKIEHGSTLLLWKDYFTKLLLTFLTLAFVIKFFYILSLLCVIAFWYIELYEEIWCNKYADYKINKNKKRKIYK
jgi:hypothetical protein